MYQRLFDLLAHVRHLLRVSGAGARANPPDASGSWRRGAARAVDRVLLSETHVWLRQIPSAQLPKHLCRHHPHLVNRFAACWGDRARVEALVDELLVDRRGGRRGFSSRVQAELTQLERLHARFLLDPIGSARSLVPRRHRVPVGALASEPTFPGALARGGRNGDRAQRSSSSLSRT
jgi:hypothetical protein